jgi:hypothetical protein
MAFCTKCGTKLNEGVKFCTGCGNAVGGVSNTPVTPAPQQQPVKPNKKWETSRTVIGIITTVLFLLLFLQSCAVSAAESLQNVFLDEAQEKISGRIGFFVSFFFLIAGILSIVCRKSKGGSITAGIVYAFCALVMLGVGFSDFPDLEFYCFISFVFSAVMIIGVIVQKRRENL